MVDIDVFIIRSTKAGFSNRIKPGLTIPSIAGSENEIPADDDETLAGNRLITGWNSGYERFNPKVFQDVINNWDDLECMWDSILMDLELASCDDFPIMVTEPLFAPTALAQNMREILFEQFNFAAVDVVPSPLLTAYAYV